MTKIQNKIELVNNSSQQSREVEKNNLPIAKYGSSKTPLKLGELEIPCYILNDKDKTRVLTGRGIAKIFNLSDSGKEFTRFINLKVIKSKISPTLFEELSNPISFKLSGGSIANGYKAELLIDLCKVVKDAFLPHLNENNVYLQRYIIADTIINASAKTGIIALIDETLGYKEKDDAKESLSRFFNSFLLKEAAKWVKTFPDSFFFNIYKMRGWTWALTNKHPAIVGQWINDLVYKRLAPGLVDEFSKINLKNMNGNRSTKNHQFIKNEYKTMLNDLFAKIDAIAKLANYDWNTFIDMLDKVAPKYPDKIND